jgi:hypothetical protein
MKSWKYSIVPILFVLGGMGWLLKVVKQLIRVEPVSGTAIVFACMFFSFAAFFAVRGVAAARKSSSASGPRSVPVEGEQTPIKT